MNNFDMILRYDILWLSFVFIQAKVLCVDQPTPTRNIDAWTNDIAIASPTSVGDNPTTIQPQDVDDDSSRSSPDRGSFFSSPLALGVYIIILMTLVMCVNLGKRSRGCFRCGRNRQRGNDDSRSRNAFEDEEDAIPFEEAVEAVPPPLYSKRLPQDHVRLSISEVMPSNFSAISSSASSVHSGHNVTYDNVPLSTMVSPIHSLLNSNTGSRDSLVDDVIQEEDISNAADPVQSQNVTIPVDHIEITVASSTPRPSPPPYDGPLESRGDREF